MSVNQQVVKLIMCANAFAEGIREGSGLDNAELEEFVEIPFQTSSRYIGQRSAGVPFGFFFFFIALFHQCRQNVHRAMPLDNH